MREVQAVAERIAPTLPPVVEEVVLTGSVSRRRCQDLSDIEMLVVTTAPLDLAEVLQHARRIGLNSLDTWGPQGTEVSRVFGYFERVPIELIWWPREFAEASVTALLAGEASSSGADALAHGIALRTAGLLEAWQERLCAYPEGLVAARIEEAALHWGGFDPHGQIRTLATAGRTARARGAASDDAERLLRIVYALNRVWQPTSKRLAERAASASREGPNGWPGGSRRPSRSWIRCWRCWVMSELQAETVALAPSGPNIATVRDVGCRSG